MSADFRLKETASGAACFESITCPGMCISIRSTSTQIQGCHFSISCLVRILTIQRAWKSLVYNPTLHIFMCKDMQSGVVY